MGQTSEWGGQFFKASRAGSCDVVEACSSSLRQELMAFTGQIATEGIDETTDDRVAKESDQRKRKPSQEKGRVATPAELEQLAYEQCERCAACGIAIEPNESELDHKIPRADGGDDMKPNLQWLCLPCNRAKGMQSMVAFVAMCRRVAGYQSEI